MSASFQGLVRHELRLAVRDGPARLRGRAIMLALLLVLPVLIGGLLAWRARSAAAVPQSALGIVSAVNAGLLLLMLSGASVYVLRSFHDRGDLDLLLSAPIPPRRVLAAKAMAVHTSVALPLLIMMSPFLLAAAWFGHPGWLGGIAMIVITAVIATSLAFVVCGWLFRHFGARRARIAIQIFGGVFAAGVAILGQAPNFAPRAFGALMDRLAPVPPAPLDWPARAVFGAPLPLLAMAGLAVAAAAGAATLAADQMGRATTAGAPAVTSRRQRHFQSGVQRILLTKELRLLGRDPELLAAISLQLAYMVPAFGLIFAGGGVSPARLASACVLFAALLPASLGWLTICGEDAPDLIAAAPVPRAAVLRAKLLAACLPALALAIGPILFVMSQSPVAGLAALVVAPVAAFGAAIQQHWVGRPQPRRRFRYRQKGSMLLAISEYVMAAAWSGTARLLIAGSPWVLATVLLAALVLFASWRLREAG